MEKKKDVIRIGEILFDKKYILRDIFCVSNVKSVPEKDAPEVMVWTFTIGFETQANVHFTFKTKADADKNYKKVVLFLWNIGKEKIQ